MLKAVLVREYANTECVLSLIFAVVMEDLKGYSILRAELIEGCVEIAAIQEVMSSIGAIHRQSLHKNLSTEKWQELVAKFRYVKITTKDSALFFLS